MADLLCKDTILKIITLKNNQIDDRGAIAIASALNVNNTLRSLNLMGNMIRETGARALISSLKNNSTITLLLINEEQKEGFAEMQRNETILNEIDPTKKANLLGKIKGIYQTPSLENLSLFSVKSHLADKEIQKLKDQNQLSDELYDKLIQSSPQP